MSNERVASRLGKEATDYGRGTETCPRLRLRLAFLLVLGLMPWLLACRVVPPTPDAPAAWDRDGSAGDAVDLEAVATAAPEDVAGLQVVIASTDLALGRERFAFGVMDASGALLPDASVNLRWFFLNGDAVEPAGQTEAIWYPARLEGAGLYVAEVDFDRAGAWGAEIEIRMPDGRQPAPQRIRFPVSQRPAAPAVGERVPPTRNRTLTEVEDIARLTSDPSPDPELYRMTVDEAVASGRPSVIVFATPAFCQSRICGPVIEEIKALSALWGEQVNFIHIEVYQRFEPLEYADEMADWGLSTEPWVFVLDREGRVAARLEGSTTQAELEPILAEVTGGATR